MQNIGHTHTFCGLSQKMFFFVGGGAYSACICCLMFCDNIFARRKPEQGVQFSTWLEFSYQWWWIFTNEVLLPKILPTSRWLCESEKHQLVMVILPISLTRYLFRLLPFSFSHMPTLQYAFRPPKICPPHPHCFRTNLCLWYKRVLTPLLVVMNYPRSQAFPPSSFWLLAVWKNGGGRPSIFYHVNDVSVYLSGQRGRRWEGLGTRLVMNSMMVNRNEHAHLNYVIVISLPWEVVVLHIGVRCSNITVEDRYEQHS